MIFTSDGESPSEAKRGQTPTKQLPPGGIAMKLLLWLSPLFPITDAVEEVQLEQIETVPRSERFPPHPPHDDLPADYHAMVERDRLLHLFLYM